MDRLVDSYLRRHRSINSRERKTIVECVFGVMRWRRRLEGILLSEGVSQPKPVQLVAAYARGIDVDEENFPNGSAAYWSYPEFLFEMLIRQYGEGDAVDLAKALNQPSNLTLRVNTLKASRDEVQRCLTEEGIKSEITRISPFGLVVDSRKQLASLNSFRDGMFEVQDEASQLVTMLTQVNPGETVLDACAGGGGKSLFMAMLMEDRGTILANDADDRKLKRLRQRAKRAGISSIRIVRQGDRAYPDKYRGHCDVVIVDSPCSGTGTLRRNPDIKWRLTPEQIHSYAVGQLELLQEYSRWLKPGGRLIYVTCSILNQENEGVIDAFVNKGPLSKLPTEYIRRSGIPDVDRFLTDEGFFRTLPFKFDMDGFFAAALG